MTNERIFLTDKLDFEIWDDESYNKPFYWTLKDSEYMNLSDWVDDAKYRWKWAS
jgi:hypothetical protein